MRQDIPRAIWFRAAVLHRALHFYYSRGQDDDENRHDLAAVAAVFPQLISIDIVIRR